MIPMFLTAPPESTVYKRTGRFATREMASKNKPAASQTRSKTPKESKKDKGQGPFKAEITITLSDKQAAKTLKNAKVITVQELARQTGVKISAANAYLRGAVADGKVQRVGGYSGHWLYQGVSS